MRRLFKTLFVLLLAGLALFLVTWPSEHLLLPTVTEGVARSIYRVSFLLRLPVMIMALSCIPIEGFHVAQSPPLTVFTCVLTPFFWYGLLLGARTLIAGVRLLRKPIIKNTDVPSPSRRAFLAQSAAGAVLAVPFGMGGYSVLIEPQRLHVRAYEFPIRDLPAELDGLRIVQVSDTHYGPFITLPYLQHAVEHANALKGDLIILTGDYVHRSPMVIERGISVFADLKARFGAVAVLGNHDHWEDADACRAAFKRIGIPCIDNARRFLTPDGFSETPYTQRSLCIGGIGDLWEDRTNFAAATRDALPDMPRIVLSHNPDAAEKAPKSLRIDLMCSGHTHGGQVWIPGVGTPVVPSKFGQKYAGGVCEGPTCPVLVSRGVGMAFMPVRFGVPPEIGAITLRRA